MIVIDASVVLSWLLREPLGGLANDLITQVGDGRLEALQPPHWLLEIAAVLMRRSPATAMQELAALQRIGLPETSDPLLLRRACDLALRHGVHVYDSLYHAIAIETPGATYITADIEYYTRARRAGSIALLEQWPSALH